MKSKKKDDKIDAKLAPHLQRLQNVLSNEES